MNGSSVVLSKAAKFCRTIRWISKKLNLIAYAALVAMMALTCSDVTARYVFNHPILGVFDATGLIGAIVIAGALAETQVLRGHISIEFLVLKLSPRPRAVLNSIIWLISLGLFAMISWRSFVYANSLRLIGEGSMSVGIPLCPFVYAIAVASVILCLVLLVDFINSLAEVMRK